MVIGVGILAALAIAAGIYRLVGPDPLFSSPDRPRAWAEEYYRILTSGTASAGHPLDAIFSLKIKSVVAMTPHMTEVTYFPAAKMYHPRWEIIDFVDRSGFSVGGRTGTLRGMDGRSINDKAGNSAVVSGTVTGLLALDGFSNPRCYLREIFDSTTHVAVSDRPSARETNHGFQFGSDVTLLHDAPLLAVFDIYHGAFRDFACKPVGGVSITDTEFTFEVLGAFDEVRDTNAYSRSTTPGVNSLCYDSDSHSFYSTTTSILYHINPPAMRNSITLEALDASGIPIEGKEMHPWDLSLNHFNCRLSEIASLRVRYLPERTRLLMRIPSMPTTIPPPAKPDNLFDLKVPKITFAYPYEMQRFIENAVQFRNPSKAKYASHVPGFPLTLQNVSPRDVMEPVV